MAAAFEYGAKVRLTREGIKKRGDKYADWIGEVICHCSPHTIRWQNGNTSDHEDWELTTNLKPVNMASLTERFKLAIKSEPEKSFIQAGVLNMDETLTSDGRDLLLSFLLEKNKDTFKTEVVDPILAAEKAE